MKWGQRFVEKNVLSFGGPLPEFSQKSYFDIRLRHQSPHPRNEEGSPV
jgi:hypothetical protein